MSCVYPCLKKKKDKNKLNAHVLKGIFVRYDAHSKIYKC